MPSPAHHSTAVDLAIAHLAGDELALRQQVVDLRSEIAILREMRSVLLDMAREQGQRITQQDAIIGKLRAELRAMLDARPGRAA